MSETVSAGDAPYDRSALHINGKKDLINLLTSENESLRLTGWESVVEDDLTDIIYLNDLTAIKKFYLSLLKSNRHDTLIKAWNLADVLIDQEVIHINELNEYTESYKIFIEDNDMSERLRAWGDISEYTIQIMMKLKIFTEHNKNILFDMIKNEDENTRNRALTFISGFVNAGFITSEDKSFFINLLRNNNLYMRNEAWQLFSENEYFIPHHIIEKNELKDNLNFFTDLLKSDDFKLRSDCWEFTLQSLLEIELLGSAELEEIKKLKEYYLSILAYKENYEVAADGWSALEDLLVSDIITESDTVYFMDLLRHPDETIRSYAWSSFSNMFSFGIIRDNDTGSLLPFFYELLKTADMDLRLECWNLLLKIIEIEDLYIDENEYTKYIPDFIELLKIDNPVNRALAWLYLTVLIDYEIIDTTEALPYIEDFLVLLKEGEKKIQIHAWELVGDLIDCDLLKIENVQPYKKYAINLLKNDKSFTDGDYTLFITAWHVANDLFDLKVLTKTDVISNVKYYIDILKHDDNYIRNMGWINVIELMDGKIITPDDIKPYNNQYIQLLESYRNDYSEDYSPWKQLPDLIKYDIITKKDKEHFLDMLVDINLYVMHNAWTNIFTLLDTGIITRVDRHFIISLLNSKRNRVAIRIWTNVIDLIKYKIITGAEKEYIIELLRSEVMTNRLYAWLYASTFVSSNIIKQNDLKPLTGQLISALKIDNLAMRKIFWDISIKYMNEKLVKKEDLVDRVDSYIDILQADNLKVRYIGWAYLKTLIAHNIVEKGIIIKYITYLKDLLKKENYGVIIRYDNPNIDNVNLWVGSWNIVENFIKKHYLDNEVASDLLNKNLNELNNEMDKAMIEELKKISGIMNGS
ncbi:MAG: hypothetical protein M1481_00390 [Candidatus Thermoplasmatota archaeon]|nr:hypothetical protein [Candidatus Thermoplasmatota archaeon]MCL5963984.1 hypothetical protein [Candidatus Thermoplasmatota archaeon]